MKRIILWLFIPIIFLTGCLNRKPTVYDEEYSEIPSDNTTEYSSEDDVNSKNLKKTQKLIDAMLNNQTLRDGLNSKYLNEIHKDISEFCVVDIDHDSENEILFTVAGSEKSYYMLDYYEGQVHYSNVSLNKNGENLRPNQKGYWQVVYQDGIILFAAFEDEVSKDRFVIDLEKYSLNNVEISKEEAQDLANDYYAELALFYEYSKDNIEKYVNICVAEIKDQKMELSDDSLLEEYMNNLNLMQKVLLGEEKFFDIKSKDYKSISDITTGSFYNGYSSLWYVDFNNDNHKEAIVGYYGMMFVLYEYNGQIYMEEIYYDSMSSIYVDGTFEEWRTGKRYRISGFTSEGIVKEQVTEIGSDKEFYGCAFTKYNIINKWFANSEESTHPEEVEIESDKDKTEHLRKAMIGEENIWKYSDMVIDIETIKHIIKGFCCMDIDHDKENEIIFFDENDRAMSILDYKDKKVHYEELSIVGDGMILNQKGYWQHIECHNDEIHYAKIIDAYTIQHELIFDYGSCTYDGETITVDACEKLINSFGAVPVVIYEFTEENIALYVDVVKKYFSENNFKLVSTDNIKLSLMQKVLMDEVEVLDTADGEMKKVSELPFYYDDGSFYYCDIDGDGVKEVILAYMENSILREVNGIIYRYAYNSRGMSPLYEDGTMNSSMGADTGCLERVVEFTQNEIITEQIYYCDRGVYYKEYTSEEMLVELTEIELATIKEKYKEIPAKSYDYSVSNVMNVIK